MRRRSSIALGLVLLLALVGAFTLRVVASLGRDTALGAAAGAGHGALVVFAIAVPTLLVLAGRFVVPSIVPGAERPFPRLDAVGTGLAALGVLALVVAPFLRGDEEVHVGWAFTMAWSADHVGSWVYLLLAGVGALCVAAALAAVGQAVALHAARQGGQLWKRLPPLAWSLYAQSVVIVVAAPLLLVALTLLVLNRGLGVGLFGGEGNPLVFMHLFWVATHALLVTAVLPAAGVALEVVRGLSGRPPGGGPLVPAAVLALALTSPLGWAQHIPDVASTLAIFSSGANMLAGLAMMLLVGHLLASLRRGSVVFASPLLYALAAGVMVMVYAWLGVGSAPLALGAFLEVHWFGAYGLDVLLAATLLALAAGMLYWWPVVCRREVGEREARVAFAFHATGLVAYFLFGPPSPFGSTLHLSAIGQRIGAGLAVAGTLLLARALVTSARGAVSAEANPWGARGKEWISSLPAGES